MIRLYIFVLSIFFLFSMSNCGLIELPASEKAKPFVDPSPKEDIENLSTEEPIRTQVVDSKREDEISPYVDCENIQNKFLNAANLKIGTAELVSTYKIISELEGAHSGAKVFLVEHVEYERPLVLKTLPVSTNEACFVENESLREAYFSCKLSNLKSRENIALGNASDFFPKLYDFGFIDSLDPSAQRETTSALPVPFIIMEFVDGMTLIDFIENSDQATAKFGFDIDTAPKNFLVGILSQIAVALLNADKAFGFRHNDLHPGNIILSIGKERITDDSIIYEGPSVKIIDFGSGFDEEHRQSLGTRLMHKVLKGREERLIEHELKDSNAWYKILFKNALALRLATYAFERDIRSLNFYLQTFSPRFEKFGFEPNRYCDNYIDCFDLIQSLTAK